MRMMSPSVMVSRLDLVVVELAAAGIDFHRLPQGLWNIGVFIEQRDGARGHRGGHNPPGRSWGPMNALVGCAPLGAPPGASPPIGCLLVHKKNPKKFRCIWTPMGIDFLRCKKQAKNNNWHWAPGQ